MVFISEACQWTPTSTIDVRLGHRWNRSSWVKLLWYVVISFKFDWNSTILHCSLNQIILVLKYAQEAVKDFEQSMTDLVTSFIETIQGQTSKLRDYENQHHERLLEMSVSILDKAIKNELDEELDDELQDVCLSHGQIWWGVTALSMLTDNVTNIAVLRLIISRIVIQLK